MRTRATLLACDPTAATGAGEFDTAVLVFGGLLMAGALVSGLVRRSFLSLTALFVLAGFVLGEGGLERARPRPARRSSSPTSRSSR